jgi:surface antigen
MKTIFLSASVVLAALISSGCAGGSGYGYGTPAVNSGLGSVGQAAMGGVMNNAIGSVAGGQSGLLNAIIQSMAASVLNGQIGQQIQPADQNFRLQQLGNLMQSGSLDQAQQWSNPQTGNSLAIQPLGTSMVDPYTRQNCREMEEIYTLSNGQQIREPRRACQGADGAWNLVQ